MKNLSYLFCAGLLFSLFLYSCSENRLLEERVPTLPETHFVYEPDAEAVQRVFGFSPSVSNAKSTLGRVLFYDRKLSGNHSVSCASCHKQHLGFADNQAFSTGANVAKTLRNSPSLSNLFSYNAFFWDSRTWGLEDLIFQPVEDHIEMRFSDREVLIDRLEETSYYPDLFEGAFGSSDIDETKITEAMTHFLESMVSMDSKFDQGSDSDFSNLNASELRGKLLFFGKATCSNCHGSGNFSEGFISNIGLDLEYTDVGAGNGHFKTPSLRNVALSSPYMHDGRFNTLKEVINHYNNNIQNHQYLNWFLQDETGNAIRLGLTDVEVDDLESFLKTLTDENYLSDERFSDPF